MVPLVWTCWNRVGVKHFKNTARTSSWNIWHHKCMMSANDLTLFRMNTNLTAWKQWRGANEAKESNGALNQTTGFPETGMPSLSRWHTVQISVPKLGAENRHRLLDCVSYLSGTRFFWYQILVPVGAGQLPVLFCANFWYARVTMATSDWKKCCYVRCHGYWLP